MTDSIKGQILTNIATRLATITTANGYSTNVKKVYYDKIPMGIQLSMHQMPCIFLLVGTDNHQTKLDCLESNLDIRLQLWNSVTGDVEMIEFERNVYKAIYAISPTAQRSDGFRSIHPNIVQFIPLAISPDLNMIEANRISEISFLVHYRTKLYNL